MSQMAMLIRQAKTKTITYAKHMTATNKPETHNIQNEYTFHLFLLEEPNSAFSPEESIFLPQERYYQ
jgi:hypothetical protein